MVALQGSKGSIGGTDGTTGNELVECGRLLQRHGCRGTLRRFADVGQLVVGVAEQLRLLGLVPVFQLQTVLQLLAPVELEQVGIGTHEVTLNLLLQQLGALLQSYLCQGIVAQCQLQHGGAHGYHLLGVHVAVAVDAYIGIGEQLVGAAFGHRNQILGSLGVGQCLLAQSLDAKLEDG